MKRRAIELFASQTRIDDYARTTLGLNQYRSAPLLHGRGFAEAFLETTAAEYRRLFQAVRLRHRDAAALEQARRGGRLAAGRRRRDEVRDGWGSQESRGFSAERDATGWQSHAAESGAGGSEGQIAGT